MVLVEVFNSESVLSVNRSVVLVSSNNLYGVCTVNRAGSKELPVGELTLFVKNSISCTKKSTFCIVNLNNPATLYCFSVIISLESKADVALATLVCVGVGICILSADDEQIIRFM